MALIERIPTNPNGSRVRYPVKRFSAPLALGQYDFGQAGNTDQVLLEMQANSVYCIERINFFAQVAEGVWLESMDTEANFPFFRLHYQNDDANSIYPEPVRCVNYIDNAEQLIFFWSTRERENLLITFDGIVNLVAGMVGLDPLLCEVNFTLYQITDAAWNKAFVEARGVSPLGSHISGAR